tara:strand:- start:19173 stop:20333 length:1161 start_codon:yes stop_codon:yes gene_type:complete
MAFILSSFLGGAAERASEIMEEERKNTQKIVDSSMRLWTELGIPAYKEHKDKTKKLSMQFDTLSRMGYNTDQIELAARDGDLNALIEYSRKAQEGKLGKDFKFVPAEVVRLSPDYKDSGRTKADFLESVLGKVERGMDLSDAIEDAGGQKTGFLGQDLSAIARKRADAYETGLGANVQTLAAFARGDVTPSEAPPSVTGTITMYDPTAEAQAEATLQGGAAGQPGVISTRNFISSQVAGRVGGKGMLGPNGQILYQHEQVDVQNKINSLVAEEVAKKKQNRFSANDLLEIEEIVLSRMQEEHNIGTVSKGSTEQTLQPDASDPITMEKDVILRIGKMPDDAGRQKADLINDTVDKIYKYYLEKDGEEIAKQKAAEARERMIKSITG